LKAPKVQCNPSIPLDFSSVGFLNALAKPSDIIMCCLATAADEKGLEWAFLLGIMYHIGQLSFPWKLQPG
jgi:hypothetical protein